MKRNPTTRCARTVAAVTASLALLAVPAVSGAATATAAPYCGITWGSLQEAAGQFEAGNVTDVRAGRHTCFDRLVLDMTGDPAGYNVRYVSTVYQDGSGLPVPVAGGARLAIIAHKGATSVPTMPDVSGYRTFRQARWAGSFEGQTTMALGVRARLPFRAFVLHGPGDGSRLVIDVAHRW